MAVTKIKLSSNGEHWNTVITPVIYFCVTYTYCVHETSSVWEGRILLMRVIRMIEDKKVGQLLQAKQWARLAPPP